MARRGRKPKPKLTEDDKLACTHIVQEILPLRKWLVDQQAGRGHREHGNTVLRQMDLLILLLAAFFNPFVRSLRLMDQLSELSWVRHHTMLERAARSTLSDAMDRFDPENLLPVVEELARQLPSLREAGRVDPELRDLLGAVKQITSADGSQIRTAADVAWAMHQGGRGKSKRQNQKKGGMGIRLNLQLDVDRFLPTELTVSGDGEGSEPAAVMQDLTSDAVYLVDRNYVHFGFLNAVLAAGSDFVVRLKSSTNFEPQEERALTERDLLAHVISDRIGVLPGSPGGRTGPPPTRAMREVVIDDPESGHTLRLLTNLLDVPAWVIGELYRLRWQVELFLRWLKVFAGYEHLLSHSRRGVTTQFYVAIIACLLIQLHTGRRPDKYTLFAMGQVASGTATMAQVMPGLGRIQREKQLERERLARKKLQAQQPG